MRLSSNFSLKLKHSSGSWTSIALDPQACLGKWNKQAEQNLITLHAYMKAKPKKNIPAWAITPRCMHTDSDSAFLPHHGVRLKQSPIKTTFQSPKTMLVCNYEDRMSGQAICTRDSWLEWLVLKQGVKNCHSSGSLLEHNIHGLSASRCIFFPFFRFTDLTQQYSSSNCRAVWQM
jgi:hypothetical protein